MHFCYIIHLYNCYCDDYDVGNNYKQFCETLIGIPSLSFIEDYVAFYVNEALRSHKTLHNNLIMHIIIIVHNNLCRLLCTDSV